MANISLGNTVTTGLVFSSDTTGNLVLTSTGGYLNLGAVTGGLVLPTGNSSQRPSTVANGTLRYNTTTSSVEGYVAGAWGAIGGAGGGITWANVQTGNFTAAVGNAYPVSTANASVYVTLPSSPGAGNTVQIVDYAQTFATNNCILNPNGGKISANTANISITTNGTSVTLVYIDSTRGWIPVDGFVSPPVGPYAVDYLIVAGGGGGGSGLAGGGGAGGVLTGTLTVSPGTAYAITVGGGGAGGAGTAYNTGVNGSNSTALGFTCVGGGYSGAYNQNGNPGGSGGGGGGTDSSYPGSRTGGSGTAGQGNAGGSGSPSSQNPQSYAGGGGGGAGAAGASMSGSTAGAGGVGISSSISGSATYYGGGGGGGAYSPGGGSAAGGGTGGGGAGSLLGSGTPGTTGTGGGGGGGGYNSGALGGGAGGSGIVIIRYLGSQRATGGTITSTGGYTIHTFSSSSTFTA